MAKEAGKLLLRDGRSGPQNGVPEGCVSRAGQSPGPDGPMFPSRVLLPYPTLPKERKKTDNPREGWEDGTPPPHRDFKERCVVR